MTTDKEIIYATSFGPDRIIKFTIFDNSSRLIITKMERNFLGLKNVIFIELDNSLNNNFIVRSEDEKYYEIFQMLLNQLGGKIVIVSNKKDTRMYGKKGYAITDEENYIEIKEEYYDSPSKLSSIELIEDSIEYSAFDSLIYSLFIQDQIEKNQKVKKIVYKTNI